MIDINEINLKAEKLSSVRVGVVQYELNEYFQQKNGLLYPNDRLAKQKFDRFLEIAKSNDVNILCFPELSLNQGFIDSLKSFANLNDIIIIGGSYYNKERKNICPIIIPEQEICYTEKKNLSPFEMSPYEDIGAIAGNEVSIIKNSKFGSFGVIICIDFLDDELKTQIYKNNIDFLFVISLNNQSDDWHTDMNRDCMKNKEGIYIIYSNSIKKDTGNGKSAIFGLMDKIYLDENLHNSVKYKFMEIIDEDILVADFDLTNKKPTVPRTISSPNIKPILPYSNKSKKDLLTFFNMVGLKEKRYQKIDDLYVPPKNFKEISNKLKDDKLVFIVGDPEIGKTYTSIKLLLDSFREGYTPIYYKGHDLVKQIEAMADIESVIKDRFVIYFEDPWGKTETSEHVFTEIGDLIDRIQEVDARVIITSRLNIFKIIEQEKKTAIDLWEHVKRLRIKIAYTEQNLRDIFSKYLITFEPKWHNNTEIIEIVNEAISNNTLKTPMSIKKLIESYKARNTDNKSIIIDEIENAARETNIVFGNAIEVFFKRGEYEKILFLSFPFISSFDIKIIEGIYYKFLEFLNKKFRFDLIKAKDFKYNFYWFKEEIDCYSEHDNTFLKFSHPSYSEGFSYAIRNNPEMYKKLFYNLLYELTKHESLIIRINVINFIFDNFAMFPSIPKSIIYKFSEDKNAEVRMVVGEIIFENFEKFSKIPYKLIKKLANDEVVDVKIIIVDIIAYNFELFPDFAKELIFKLVYDDEAKVRIMVGEVIFENFEKFSKIPYDLINILSNDEDVEVKISAADIVTNNYKYFPEFARNILRKFSDDKNIDLRTSIGHEIAENFEIFPSFAKRMIIKFSNDPDPSVRILSGNIVSINYDVFPELAENLIEKLSNDLDFRVRHSAGVIIAENFEHYPKFAEYLTVKLSNDEDPTVRVLVTEIILDYFEEFSKTPNDIINNLYDDVDFRVRKGIGKIIALKFNEFGEIPYQIIDELSKDNNSEVKIVVGDIVANNFQYFPDIAEKLVIKLSEDKDLKVKKCVGYKFAKIFGKHPYLAEKYIKMLSNYEDIELKKLISEIFIKIFGSENILAINLLKNLSNDDDVDVRLTACEIIEIYYDLFPELAENLLEKLSADHDDYVRIKADDIINKDSVSDFDFEKELEEMNIDFDE